MNGNSVSTSVKSIKKKTVKFNFWILILVECQLFSREMWGQSCTDYPLRRWKGRKKENSIKKIYGSMVKLRAKEKQKDMREKRNRKRKYEDGKWGRKTAGWTYITRVSNRVKVTCMSKFTLHVNSMVWVI